MMFYLSEFKSPESRERYLRLHTEKWNPAGESKKRMIAPNEASLTHVGKVAYRLTNAASGIEPPIQQAILVVKQNRIRLGYSSTR